MQVRTVEPARQTITIKIMIKEKFSNTDSFKKLSVFLIAQLFLLSVPHSTVWALWTNVHGNSQHNGLSQIEGPSSGDILWKFTGQGIYIFHTPLVAYDGNIIVQKGTGNYMTGNDGIYSINPDGSVKWFFLDESQRFAPISLSSDGKTVYAVGIEMSKITKEIKNSKLYSIDVGNGKVNWTKHLSDHISETWISRITTASDGTIYVKGGDKLFALTPEGEKIWSYRFLLEMKYGGAHHTSGPTLSPDEKTLYLMKRIKGGLMAMDAKTGKTLWHNKREFHSDFASPVVAPDGTIFLVDMVEASVIALNPDGTIKWENKYEGKTILNTFPTVGTDNNLYITIEEPRYQVDSGTLYALDIDSGNEKWSHKFDFGVLSSPMAVDKDGNIYTAKGDGNFYSLSSKGEMLWNTHIGFKVKRGDEKANSSAVTQFYMSGPALSDGRVYSITGDFTTHGTLVSLGSKDGALKSPEKTEPELIDK